MKNYSSAEVQKLLDSAQNILICLPKNVTLDQVAAGLSLFLSLQKAGKNPNIVAAEPMTVGFSHLVGLDKVKDKVLGPSLILTINCPIENIDKVSTQDDGKHLSLIIVPKPGMPSITPDQIVFDQRGMGIDLIITLGARKLEDLGKIYPENRRLFQEKPLINIDNNFQNSNFGKCNIVDSDASSCSEIIVSLISGMGLPFDEDISSNLLLGLREETKNFQAEKVSADTFEAAAFCLRLNKKKEESFLKPEEKTEKNLQPPSDWLEPKIYKGSTLP